ncbi:MAG: DNA-processing protein DprA [Anaerovoracaceae bacterium]
MEREEYCIIEKQDPGYPESLIQLGNDAPEQLWCMGNTELLKERCAAVVGSRKPTRYGQWVAFGAGRILARHGIVTVSGMAMGCDSEAHKGALYENGPTIAVLGCGIDICYPRGSQKLRKQIMEKGLLITEFPPGTPPTSFRFPRRNRIISGLSELTVVAEAALASGSLITAGYAAQQGREVLAAPGNIANPMSIGCNKLIQDGATPLVCLDDIIRTLGLCVTAEPSEIREQLGKEERKIYGIVKRNGEMTADELAEEAGVSVSQANAYVTVLEIKGFLESSMGKIFAAK